MTGLDIALICIFVAAAIVGFARGFVVSAFSLVGIVLGLAIAAVAVKLVVGPSVSPYAPLAELIVAVTVTLAIAIVLRTFGRSLHAAIRMPGGIMVDRVLGALFAVAMSVVLVWAGSAVIALFPAANGARAALRDSTVIQELDAMLPSADSVLQAAARFDPLPSFSGPSVSNLPAPDPAVLQLAGVRTAHTRVVRILGEACGMGVTGSGWVVAPHLVATNAHVVAGEQSTSIQIEGRGPRLHADVVYVDSFNDIALLRVDDLDLPVLQPSETTTRGELGASLGFPEDGPFDARAARIAGSQKVAASDLYGERRGVRQIVVFRGLVRPGNSGGPLVDAHGRVVAMVFAHAVDAPTQTGYAIPVSLVEDAISNASGSVSTGPCVS